MPPLETSSEQSYHSSLTPDPVCGGVGRPDPMPLPGPHLKEAEGSQPAGSALLILTAEDAKPLVAISKLVRLWGEETGWFHIFLPLGPDVCLPSPRGAGRGVWVTQRELRSPR